MADSPAATGPLDHVRNSIALLATRRFGTFWLSTMLSNLGFWAQQVAEPWLLLDLRASPFVIGLDAFMLDGPQWLFTLAGGVLADHGDRRRVIAVFQGVQMLCPIGLAVLVAAGWIAPWMVIVFALVCGVTDALSMPSYQTIALSIVEPAQVATGVALNSIQLNLSRVLGPAVAGVLLATVGVVGCFAINAASYVPFIAVALWILPPTRPVVPFDHRRPFMAVRAVIRDPDMQRRLLTVLVTGLFAGGLVTFASVFVREIFGGGSAAFSAVIVAYGVGGLAGASALLALDPQRDHRSRCSWLAGLAGGLVVAAAIDPWLWLLPVIAAGAGAAVTASNTLANTMIQRATGDDGRGQAASLFMLAMRGGGALGSLATGGLVYGVGVRGALTIDGIAAIVLQIAIARRWRERRRAAARADDGSRR